MKNKKIKILFVSLFVLLFPFSVSASLKCSDISDAVESYNSYVEKLEELDCENIEDEEVVAKCNDYSVKKAVALSRIFSYNDENTKCSKKKLESIVEENKDQCTNVFGTKLKDIAHYGMNFFYVVAPFLFMIFGILDFTKIVTMSSPNQIKESKQRFIKRLISFLLIFFIPAILNLIFNTSDRMLTYDSNIYSCTSNVSFHMQKWETTYVPQGNGSSNGNSSLSSGSASNILDAASQVHELQKTYTYSVGAGIVYNDIETSLNNPSKVTCCATYVGTVLYVAGIFTEDEMNSYGYNSAPATSDFLASKGWIRINDYSDLQAGDVVFMTSGSDPGVGHTQLYAGNGTWYNAGSTEAIQRESPYASSEEYIRSRFLHAYRKP